MEIQNNDADISTDARDGTGEISAAQWSILRSLLSTHAGAPRCCKFAGEKVTIGAYHPT